MLFLYTHTQNRNDAHVLSSIDRPCTRCCQLQTKSIVTLYNLASGKWYNHHLFCYFCYHLLVFVLILLYVVTYLLSSCNYNNICYYILSYFYILLAFLFENWSNVLSLILRNSFACKVRRTGNVQFIHCIIGLIIIIRTVFIGISLLK